ncbi:serine hydrolase domain-containing protein [Flavobacterium pectinovorum]|uniref:serine hydrolase domain-containing protein n=1 Tax=Flavobacterium pectinovorum TaxID=29533 RepID=UPI00265DD72F|nr:serine hydrolase domain-containing protein [Flavobacterium pectinovorum]WKL50527.1 serine hydrolase domain-containing protein [Flavobacterium pectinovorum]
MKMSLLKKTNIPQILFLILVFASCGKEKATTQKPTVTVEEDTLPKMKPAGPEKRLPANYVNSVTGRINHFYNKNWPNNSMNGSFLVARNGHIIFERYNGFANKNEGTKITAETSVQIASVSKVLTATAVLKLVNAGKIDLDQKVNTILKTFPYENCTIRMLLSHRTGMRNYAYFTDHDKSVWDRHNQLTNQDILDILATKNIALEAPTGTRFSYCNTNYAMLALIIEKVTGLKYKEAMSEMIFKPLGMTHTYVFDDDKDRKNIVPSYKGNGVEIGFDYLDNVYGDKNIFSTVRDLLKFDRARNAPGFLKPELLKEVYTGYSNERKGTKNYGLGIRMINWDSGQNYYFHNGWWHGNTSSYVPLMKENVTIIALSNKMTRKTYAVRKLAPIFGDYPFVFKDEE